LKIAYLDLVRKWPFYGSTFFKARYIPGESVFFKQEFEGKVRVGINENGVHIIDPKALKVVSLRFEQILSWNSEKKRFWFYYQKEDNSSQGQLLKRSQSTLFALKQQHQFYQFAAYQSELMDDLLCDWANEFGFYDIDTTDEEKNKRRSTRNTQNEKV